jgi:adenylate cyclase
VSESSRAVFLSYASQDADAAARICDALRSAGIEVWFDQTELRGGEAWDRQIRKQIRDCALFVPLISASAHARVEGYFRLEWKLAVDRSHLMAPDQTFLLPVVIDDTPQTDERIPDRFRELQWSRLPGGCPSPAFLSRVERLLTPESTVFSQQPVGPTPAAATAPSVMKPPRPKRASTVIVAALLAAALAYIALEKFWIVKHAPPSQLVTSPTTALPAAPEKSIAVLPFSDLSEKHDQEYFADGMAEEIIDLLAKVPDLRVPARTSSFYFKGKSARIPEIARELSVANILEGSVRRSGNRIRVTAQLARADDGYHLWSQTYDRDLKDVFAVQDDIANAVAQALQITLMGGPLSRPRGGTENLEAYQLYLRGLSANRQNTRASVRAARDYFDESIKLDPGFGLAWFALGWDTGLLTDEGEFLPKDGYERARQQTQRALQLSPDLAEAHALLSYIHRAYDWDWEAAAAESRAALTLDPKDPLALMQAGALANTLGRWDEAERQLRLALTRDPFFPLLSWYLGDAQYGAGHFADSEATFRKMLDFAPGFSWTRSYLTRTLLAEDKAEAAVAMVMQEGDEENRLSMLSMALHAAHREAEAEQALKMLIAKFAGTDAYWVAMTYAHRGDNDLALQWLDRAYAQRDSSLNEILGEHVFKRLVIDPRYKAFLRKMNLPGQ